MAGIKTINPMERKAIFAGMRPGMMNGMAVPSPMFGLRSAFYGRPPITGGDKIPQIPQVTPPMPPMPPPAGGMLPNPTPGMMPPSVTPWGGMGGMGGGMPQIVGGSKIKAAKMPKKKKLSSATKTGVKISGLPMATVGTPKSPKFRGGAPPPKFGG